MYSHSTAKFLKKCRIQAIILEFFVPHSSAIAQPNDLSLFGVTKKNFVKGSLAGDSDEKIIATIVDVVDSIKKAATPMNIVNSFKLAGFCIQRVPGEIDLPSNINRRKTIFIPNEAKKIIDFLGDQKAAKLYNLAQYSIKLTRHSVPLLKSDCKYIHEEEYINSDDIDDYLTKEDEMVYCPLKEESLINDLDNNLIRPFKHDNYNDYIEPDVASEFKTRLVDDPKTNPFKKQKKSQESDSSSDEFETRSDFQKHLIKKRAVKQVKHVSAAISQNDKMIKKASEELQKRSKLIREKINKKLKLIEDLSEDDSNSLDLALKCAEIVEESMSTDLLNEWTSIARDENRPISLPYRETQEIREFLFKNPSNVIDSISLINPLVDDIIKIVKDDINQLEIYENLADFSSLMESIDVDETLNYEEDDYEFTINSEKFQITDDSDEY